VFSSGTISWTWGLDGFFRGRADARIQRTTSNILNAFLFGAPTLQALGVAAPATATPGQSFNVTVTARDAQGQPFTGYTGTVHFTSSDTSAGVVLPPDSTLTSGQGTFSATLITTGPQTITATDTATASITGTLTTSVRAAAAASLGLSAPASATAGQSFNVTVTARDAQGQPFTGYTGTVHFTSSDTSAGVVLPPDSTLTNGVGTRS